MDWNYDTTCRYDKYYNSSFYIPNISYAEAKDAFKKLLRECTGIMTPQADITAKKVMQYYEMSHK